MRSLAATATLLILTACVAWSALTGAAAGRHIAGIGLLVYLLIERRHLGPNARRMMRFVQWTLLVVLIVPPLPGVDGPLSSMTGQDRLAVRSAKLLQALDDAGMLIGLFTALNMLRDAAQSSALLQRCGSVLVRQPPGRRFLALSLGAHLVGLVLNFGVLPLLGTMVVRGNSLAAAGGDPEIVAIRQQRMMTALMRGFALMTVWSPLSVSFAVTEAVVPGVNWARLLPLQGLLTILLLALAWGLDRRAFPPRLVVPQGGRDPEPGDGAAVGKMLALVLGVVGLSVAMAHLVHVRLIEGAMVVVPVAAWLWLAVQRALPSLSAVGWGRALVGAVPELGRRLRVSLPEARNEVAILGGSLFLGSLLGSWIPSSALAWLVETLHLPALALAIMLSFSVIVLARLGISQLITVTLIGHALSHLTGLGLNPAVLASGLMAVWSLSICVTTVGAAVLWIARMSDVPIAKAGWGWNAAYVVIGAVVVAVWMIGLSFVPGLSLAPS